MHIHGNTLLTKANEFVKDLYYNEVISAAWIDHFKRRHGIKQVSKSGEEAGTNQINVAI